MKNKRDWLWILVIIAVTFIAMPVMADDGDLACSTALLGTTAKVKNGRFYYPAYYLQLALNIMKYIGVIACIVLSVVDFLKALFSEDKDGYKKVVNTSLKRLGYAVAIFFLPIAVMQILKLAGVVTNATCGIS